MQMYIASLTLLLLAGMVAARVMLLKRRGISAFRFGKTDTSDFIILPFAAFYFYLVFATTLGLSAVRVSPLFRSVPVSWLGVLLCVSGLCLFAAALVSFRTSFRVGIDTEHPDRLITTGVFAFTRNPIYVAFWLVLLGEFLVFQSIVFLLYFSASLWLIHRQVLREEEFLRGRYGQEYAEYCSRVHRYL